MDKGGNALLGCKIDFDLVGKSTGMIVARIYGTACLVKSTTDGEYLDDFRRAESMSLNERVLAMMQAHQLRLQQTLSAAGT